MSINCAWQRRAVRARPCLVNDVHNRARHRLQYAFIALNPRTVRCALRFAPRQHCAMLQRQNLLRHACDLHPAALVAVVEPPRRKRDGAQQRRHADVWRRFVRRLEAAQVNVFPCAAAVAAHHVARLYTVQRNSMKLWSAGQSKSASGTTCDSLRIASHANVQAIVQAGTDAQAIDVRALLSM